MNKSILSKLNPFSNKKARTDVGGGFSEKIKDIANTDVSPYLKKSAGYAGAAGVGLAKGAGRFGLGVLKAPLNVAEGQGVIGGIIPEWLKKVFKFIFKFIFGTALILLFIILLVAIYNYFQSGVGSSQVVHAEAGVQDTAIPIVAKLGLTNVYNSIFNPEKLTSNYGFESEIQAYEGDADLGVKLVSMEQIGRPYYNEPIEVLSMFRAKSNANTKLVVTCKFGEEEPAPALISALQATEDKSNEVTLIKGETTLIDAQCKFPKGIDPKKKTRVIATSDYVINPLTTEEKIPVKSSEIVKVFVAFEFNQKASHNTYFMPAGELRSLLTINQDPFKYYKINEPHLTSDRKVQSIATNGPLNLGIGTHLSQPFVEKKPYSFAVTFKSNNWKGNLKQLKSLKIHVPPFISLEGDSDYGEKTFASTCTFDNTGQLDEDGFKIYTLKESLISRTNQECDKLTLEKAAITEQQCIDLYGKNQDMTFGCYFKANELPQEQGMRGFYIGAETDYIFQFENTIAVDAIKRPDMIS